MKLIAGSYERFLFGYQLKYNSSENDALQDEGGSGGTGAAAAASLSSSFSYAAHLGPIKAVAAMGGVAVSGGSDDVIRVYDVANRTDMGSLIQHEGAVTALEFHGEGLFPTHLFSASEDGTICIWDSDSWQHLMTLRGHRTSVDAISVHPSGRLALSASRDTSLRMWNLIGARCSFRTKLPAAPSFLHYSPLQGSAYAVGFPNSVLVFSAEDGREVASLPQEAPALCSAFCTENLLAIGGESKCVALWDLRTGHATCSNIEDAHKCRLRGIVVPTLSGASSDTKESRDPYIVVSASSDGHIKVWDLRKVGGGNTTGAEPLVADVDTKARLTCLAIGGFASGKRAAKKVQAVPIAENGDASRSKSKGRKRTPEMSGNGVSKRKGK